MPATPSGTLPQQNYTPASTRSYKHWGTPSWAIRAHKYHPDLTSSTHLPSATEAPHVIKGAAGQLTPWTPPAISGQYNALQGLARLIGPIMDFYSGGAFGRGWDTANAQRLNFQREQFEMGRERMMDMSRNVIMQHKDMLMQYQQIFEEYEDGGISKEQAEQEVEDLARRNQDQGLIDLLHNGGLRGVNNFLSWQDAKMMDVWGAYTSMAGAKKSSGKTAKEESEYDASLSTDSAGVGVAGGGMGGGRRALPGGPDDPDITDVSDPESDTGEPTADNQEDNDAQLGKTHHLTAQGVRDAHDMLKTGKINDELTSQYAKANPFNYGKVFAAAGDLRKQMQRAVNDPKLDTPEKRLERLNAIDPDIADAVDGMIKYQTDPKEEKRQIVKDLAKEVDPHYRSGNYALVQELSSLEKPVGKEMQRVASLSRQAMQVLSALKELPEDEKIPNRQLDAMLAGTWTGEAKYTNLYHSIQAFANEVGAVSSGTGTARMTAFKQLTGHLKEYSSPAQIRGALVAEAQVGQSVLDTVQNTWNNYNPGAPNPIIENNVDLQHYEAIMHMNTETGEIAAGDDPYLAYVSKKPPEGANVRHPLSSKERSDIRDFIRENQHSDDPAMIARVQKAVEMIGATP